MQKNNTKKTLPRENIAEISCSYDAIVEINLCTGFYIRTILSNRNLFQFPDSGMFEAVYEKVLDSAASPEDVLVIQKTCSLHAMRDAFDKGRQQSFCKYHLKSPSGKIYAMEARVLCFHGEQGDYALLITSNVTCGTPFPVCQFVHQYDIALRNIYDELYEMNLTYDSYRIVYHVEDKYVSPPEKGVLSETVKLASEQMIYPEDKQRFLDFFSLENISNVLSSGKESMIGEFRKLWTDGKYHWTSLTILPLPQTRDESEILLCFIMDIEDKKRVEQADTEVQMLKRQQVLDERYEIIVRETGTIVFERNLDEQYTSPKIAETFMGDYTGRDVIRVWYEDQVVHPDDRETFYKFCNSAKNGGSRFETTVRLLNRKNRYIWCRVAMTYVLDESGQVQRVIGTVNDVDESIRSRKVLEYRAQYDSLTDIYNENGFFARAKELLEHRLDQQYAVIRMDINRFKFINELYGFEEGNKLLCHIARTIQSNCDLELDAYGRINSDIFGLMLAFTTQKVLIERIEKMIEAISGYSIGYTVSPSFGICVVDDRTVPINILCDRASMALGTIKGNLITRWAFYDDNLRAKQLRERMIENEMERALQRGEFEIFLQPKHELDSSRIIGAEALVRWNHPKEGLLSPSEFIPLFERNGFIMQLDEYVWEQTLAMMRRWIDEGNVLMSVSVNVSRLHIYNSDFEKKILALLDKYRIPSFLLELELTESMLIENADALYKTMKILQNKGTVFTMDDFGAGYSSLNMLKNVPVRTIKLDREFLNESTASSKGKTIVQSVIGMARQLGLFVVAEGVETQEQVSFLLQAGCTAAQGFYFSKPMPVKQFEELAFDRNKEGSR